MIRCDWAGDDPLYIQYHDIEWGVPTRDDKVLFEFLVLESAQAGLSWITILRKRENYRKQYEGFDPLRVSKFNDDKIKAMLEDKGIIRNRRKIESSINNAKMFLKVQEEFGSFSSYIWGFVNNEPIVNHYDSIEEMPAYTELSDRITKDMKKRGFKFIGTTIIYSFLQAVGIVDDHISGCFKKGG